ncbi:hypothetical protein Patl1_34687 [Pistacia atlantica]|uniref:Uncharacterized protein n=1 Tax=Pistacia atlantica TaxID=434234 RepID=A0ACC0ZQC6_9ROSI|nr:hypothetical protein Patl1_34687 [Pistacia atlantica]
MLSLFNNPEAIELIYSFLVDKEAEFCKDMAENFFMQQQYDLAIFSIVSAKLKNPQLHGLNNYLNAYMVHKIDSTIKDEWYAVLGIKDHGVGADEIKKRYKDLAVMIHPEKCSSVAAEGATKLINEAWETLSDARKREAYGRFVTSSSKRSRKYDSSSPSKRRRY